MSTLSQNYAFEPKLFIRTLTNKSLNLQLLSRERFLKSVREPDQEMPVCTGGCPGHHPHRTARMHQRLVGATDLNRRDNLCASGNVVRLMRHLWAKLPIQSWLSEEPFKAGDALSTPPAQVFR